ARVAPVSSVAAVAPRRIAAFFSNVERDGPIEIPSRLEIRSYFGNVELDLSAARFAPGITEIAIRVFCGNVELRVPANAVVENDGVAILASFSSHAAEPTRNTTENVVRLHVKGRAILGNVEIEPAVDAAHL